MTTQDIVLLIIGIGLILGAFMSTWVFMKVIRDIEKKSRKKNKTADPTSIQ